MTIERAVIYARVSSDQSGTGRSVTEQLADCRAECARNGWPIGEEVTDVDIGASEWSGKDRPGFRQLFQVLRRGDVLVVWELSRLSRNDDDRAAIASFCKPLGIPWHSGGRTYDPTDADDAFTLDIGHAVSKKESAQTRARIIRALKANAADGKWHGRTVYGYRAVRDPGTGKITARVPDEVTAPIVREAAERILKGDSQRSIALDFTARGLLTSNGSARWQGFTIRTMLLRPVYAGLRVHNGVVVQGNWEPILSPDEFARLGAVLTDPARPQILSRGTAPKYLLSGIALCGTCQRPLYKHMNHKRPIYKCMSSPSHMARELSKVDGVVIAEMLRAIEQYRVELFFRDAETDHDVEPTAVSDVGDHLAKARELQQRLDAVYDEVAEGKVSAAALARIEARLLPQIETAKEAARSAARVSDPSAKVLNTPAEDLWASWTLDEQRDFVRSAAEIVVMPGAGRVFDPSLVQVTLRKNLRQRPEGFEHYEP
ncbi:recombinase family protein [Rhodococcus sp. PAMC28707]|uniref:recombinase family protein n=1 Tax=unclassified Rhodococcus (in: high G+C Gram-positive bacteria) TaxID=192944 RepID=UPI00109E32C4|nr:MULTISPECIES: recombinase family protein [unclassified Rhodococcus (in: high G+C Gram-positive bacteria)]QCB50547.1 recombinase family protein [Rhodococcus sp. PAMC28705]QCB57761.1 recombinase family protein [Rhodococcus sp. PAMC28707]